MYKYKEKLIMLLRSDVERLDAIRYYIINSLDSDLNIKGLSFMFGLSCSTLRRQFQNHFQITVYKYILQQRMECARELIIACTHTISEISEKTGYSESSNFSHAFIKYFGISPTKFCSKYGFAATKIIDIEHNKHKDGRN